MALMNEGYQLIIIEDEQVALAGGIPSIASNSAYFMLSLITILVIAAIVVASLYISRAKYYRNQLEALAKRTDSVKADTKEWRISNMKAQISVLQASLAAANVLEFM